LRALHFVSVDVAVVTEGVVAELPAMDASASSPTSEASVDGASVDSEASSYVVLDEEGADVSSAEADGDSVSSSEEAEGALVSSLT